MLDSGKTLAGPIGPYQLYAAAQLAYQAKDWAAVAHRAEQAVAAGYTGDADLLIAEVYFAQKQDAAGP